MIGLVELGWDVVGYDCSIGLRRAASRVALGRESGADELLLKHVESGQLMMCASLEEATNEADLIVIASASSTRDGANGDASAVDHLLRRLRRLDLMRWPTVVLRSIVPLGSSDGLNKIVEGWGELVYAPEFLREGHAVSDFLNPERIVVGSDVAAIGVPFVRLFESLKKPVVFTTRCSAELIQVSTSAFLALKASFANEVASLCDVLGASADDVLRGVAADNRSGSQFLGAGAALGGSRYLKDLEDVQRFAGEHDVHCDVLSAALRVNAAEKSRIISIIEEQVGSLEGLTIGVWGLVSGAGADDARGSFALNIVGMLSERGATVVAYDPSVHVAFLSDGCRLAKSPLEAADADVLLVLTAWPIFYEISPPTYAALIKRRIVIDSRNVLDGERVAAAGLTYRGVGRSITNAPYLLASAQ